MNKFEALGFTSMDGFIAVSCVAAGVIGALLDYLIKRENFISLNAEPELKLKFSRYIPLMLGRSILGMAGGCAVYLLLLDSISLDKSGYTRLIVLSALAGFSAPVIFNKYKNKIPNALSENLSANKSNQSDAQKARTSV